MELAAIAMLRAKLADLERHAESLGRSASNAPEGLIVDGYSRLATMHRRRSQRQAQSQGLADIAAAAERSEGYASAALQRVATCIDQAEKAVVRAMLLRMEADALASWTPEQDGQARQSR